MLPSQNLSHQYGLWSASALVGSWHQRCESRTIMKEGEVVGIGQNLQPIGKTLGDCDGYEVEPWAKGAAIFAAWRHEIVPILVGTDCAPIFKGAVVIQSHIDTIT